MFNLAADDVAVACNLRKVILGAAVVMEGICNPAICSVLVILDLRSALHFFRVIPQFVVVHDPPRGMAE